MSKSEVITRMNAKNISEDGDCRILLGIYCDAQGYGKFTVAGRSEYLHRVIMWLASDYEHIMDIPKNMQVAHLCRNKCCITFSHFQLVDPIVNASHKKQQGTYTEGENHHSAKMTLERAQALADSWSDVPKKKQKERAVIFGVSVATVEALDERRSWSQVDHPNGKTFKGHNGFESRKIAKMKNEYTPKEILTIRNRLLARSTVNELTKCHMINISRENRRPIFSIFGQSKPGGRWAAIVSSGVNQVDKNALHSCNHGDCVNPDHLRWGSQSENLIQAFDDGILKRELSDSDIISIKNSQDSLRQLAKAYNVNRGLICDIRKDRNIRAKYLIQNASWLLKTRSE